LVALKGPARLFCTVWRWVAAIGRVSVDITYYRTYGLIMSETSTAAGVASMAPGPALGAVLDSLSLATVPNGDVVDVLQGWGRLLAHVQAGYLAAMVEVGRRDPAGGDNSTARLDSPGRYAADEIRAALTLTLRAAEREHEFAEAVVITLPSVHAALSAGEIDRAKAWVFVQHLADLPGELAATVCAVLLPKAGGLTTGQLGAQLAKLIIKLDPDRAKDQYTKALTRRAVVGYLKPDGTAVISGNGLAPDEAAAATTRIEHLARTAKRAGHPDPIDHIRADLYIRLLDGRFEQLTRDEIITALLASATNTATNTGADVPDTDTPDPDDEHTGDTSADDVDTDSADVATVVGVEVRARLDTLLGLNELPGELPGWGHIIAPITRRLVARQHHAQWRWVVTGADGHLISEGITRRRPTGTDPPDHDAHGGIVELQVPATVLAQLAADPPRAWAKVIGDIAAQHTHATTTETASGLDENPDRRLPAEALRRHVHIRDRTCSAPGCRRSAHQCDQDHTVEYHVGGTTVRANLGPACRHHHNLRHRGGWTVHQPQPGHFTWTSPLHRSYHTRGTPITDPDEESPPF
jgi:Domain of unknown function (DUF222)